MLRSDAYTFRAAVADRLRRGPVMLVGDAAHLTPPFIGQGLGLWLGDAHNLAWKLAQVLREKASDDLLASYGDERDAHVRDVVRTAIRVGRAMTGGQGAVATLRRPIAATLLRLPGVGARAAAALTTRYPPGPWVDDRRRRRDLEGTACPQPRAQRGGVGGRDLPRCERVRPLPQHVPDRTVRDQRESGPEDVVERHGRAAVTDQWLRAGRTAGALLRPDRIVMATDRS